MRQATWILTAMAALALGACGGTSAKDIPAAASSVTPPASAAAAAPTNNPTRAVPATATPTLAPPSTPTPVPAKLEVVQTGFFSYKDTTGANISPWVAIVRNPSSSQIASSTRVSALFFGADGVLLKTETGSLPGIWPGQTVAAGSSYASIPGAPARLEIRLDGTKFDTPLTLASFQITEAAFVPDRFSPKVRAKISSPYSIDLKDLSIVCVVDKGPDIVGIGSTFLTLLPAKATAVGECNIDSRHPTAGATGARLFAGVSNLTLLSVTPVAGR